MFENTKKINTKNDFLSFVHELSQDYYHNPDAWENKDLGSFLEALAAWVEDMEGYYLSQDQAVPERPNWQMVANMLAAAKIYE
jgi:hypothetical protein